ncbi:MAG: serine--tRNA ligase, partial [Pseudomonadales bacterium]
MLDPRTIRQELTATAEQLRIKGFELDVPAIESLESRRKALQVQTEELQAERNTRSKAIGKAKAAGEDIQPLLDAVASLGDQLDEKKTALDDVQAELNDILM